MTEPVDLTNLRSMTDGDTELEKALFEEFYSSFESGIANLHLHSAGGNMEAWRQESHALKGIALNMGADTLGELCKKAQEAYASDKITKDDLLEKIEKEYLCVKEYLQHSI
jgi:HPt (histidine-containing phosphotransfer) domain-containing protein